jgi:DNA-binding transcriptional LysR family regulator
MFSLDQLRCFVAVADERHFGRAAELLQMTQPPLSRQIQRLERAVGVMLLERNNRAVSLTVAGEVFLEEARTLLALAQALPVSAQRVAQGLAGTVRVGFTATAAFGVLGGMLDEVEKELPSVKVTLQEMVTSEQFDALERGELDLGLLRPPVNPEKFGSRLLHRERLILAVPAADPLAQREGVLRISDLKHAHLMMYSPHSAAYFHNLASHLLGDLPLQSVQYITQVSTMVALVNAGRGLALVPASVAVLRPANVVFREVQELARDVVEHHLVWRRPVTSPALARVLDILHADDVHNDDGNGRE